MTEQRYNKDAVEIEDGEPEKGRVSLSDMLDRKRKDALAKEAAEEQAKKLDALDEKLNRPFTAGDLVHTTGGPGPGVIDSFFADDPESD